MKANLTQQNVKFVCRVCLGGEDSSESMQNVFDQNAQATLNFAEIYSKFTSLPVLDTDGISPYLCQSCCNQLINFNEFRHLCETSYEFLQNQRNVDQSVIGEIQIKEENEIEIEYNSFNELVAEEPVVQKPRRIKREVTKQQTVVKTRARKKPVVKSKK